MPGTFYGNKAPSSTRDLGMVTKIFSMGYENLDLIQAVGSSQIQIQIQNKSN